MLLKSKTQIFFEKINTMNARNVQQHKLFYGLAMAAMNLWQPHNGYQNG
jgi:hypothetical protein